MYKLKNMVRRSAAFTAAVSMLAGIGASAVPAITFADALNPLTQRSLTLSSSAPGWSFTDGSGNPDFAPPGSGPNGKKTGETFSFRVSTDSNALNIPIKAMTFQYCTAPAGNCTPPGNGAYTPPNTTGLETSWTEGTSNLDLHYGVDAGTDPVEGTDYKVYVATNDTVTDLTSANITSGDIVQSTGWELTVGQKYTTAGSITTERNFATLTQTGGVSPTPLKPAHDYKMWVIFSASEDNYITNPGHGAFFVRLNTYSEDGTTDPADIDPLTSTKIIDGGVTVANVMNDSIWITTKVLETMAFSVGVDNPDAEVLSGSDTHGLCDPITNFTNTRIQLGNSAQEFSLSPSEAYDAHSYWRLSTNSSAGASVYYSGNTLNNTVGDSISEIGVDALNGGFKPHYGMEQFGLALDSSSDTIDTAHGAVAASLSPLNAEPAYANGAGEIHAADWSDNVAKFSFTAASTSTPELIATENNQVIDCSTGKMRYVANIAPSTPAGVYTTKVNYIAAPQY